MTPQFRGSETPEVNAARPFPGSLPIEATLFPPSSRYHGLKVLQHTTAAGNLIAYLDRRGYLQYLVRAVCRARPGIDLICS